MKLKPVSSPTGRVSCNSEPFELRGDPDGFVPYGACELQQCGTDGEGNFSSFVPYGACELQRFRCSGRCYFTCFVPYGACELQQSVKIRSEKPLLMRLLRHAFSAFGEPMLYYSICECVCQHFLNFSAFYQCFTAVRTSPEIFLLSAYHIYKLPELFSLSVDKSITDTFAAEFFIKCYVHLCIKRCFQFLFG